MILNEGINPLKLKTLSTAEKKQLAGEIRGFLIDTVSKTGGHLASNLGTVELIIALHSVFKTPQDKFIFDVGHQAYTHKILTGRMNGFKRLRSLNGISGFPRSSESIHDAFLGGHSSISVSAAIGVADAMRLNGNRVNKVVAIVGDGAMTGGEIYEGLNNIRSTHGNLIIVLNDNEMSISKSSGSIASYLSQIRSTKGYYRTKQTIKGILAKTELGKGVSRSVSETKRIVRDAVIQNNLFENLGIKYYGLIDGHNIDELIQILEFAKSINDPCLIHVKTVKGKGYVPAEENSGHYHGIDAVKSVNVPAVNKRICAGEILGRELLRLGKEDERICVITAAMKYATGCNYFAKAFKERFFDAGIAESHSVTFSAALASMGKIPIFAVYSTFLQRGFDQLIHDASIENLHIVLCIDRAGLTGEDGETHMGIFDVPMLRIIPGTVIFSPASDAELKACFNTAVYDIEGIAAVRYPKGALSGGSTEDVSISYNHIKMKKDNQNAKKLIITYGRLTAMARRFITQDCDLLQLIQIYPIPEKAYEIIKTYYNIIFIEESSEKGGIAELLTSRLISDNWRGNYKYRGIKGFVPCASSEEQAQLCGLDYNSLKEFITADEKT